MISLSGSDEDFSGSVLPGLCSVVLASVGAEVVSDVDSAASSSFTTWDKVHKKFVNTSVKKARPFQI